MRDKSISIFFPAYNDGATIRGMVNAAISTLESLTDDYEIIIVNDGSADNTEQVLNELKKNSPRIKVVHHLKNKGYGAALKAGFAESSKGLIFYTDGDGQYDVRELALLVSAMKDGIDIVNGYKIRRADPLYRIMMGKLYYWMVRLIFNLRLKDITCDFRLFRKSVFDKIDLESNSGAICVEMMKKLRDAGFVTREVPVHHYPRRYGRSQSFTLLNLLKMAVELRKIWLGQCLRNNKDRQ